MKKLMIALMMVALLTPLAAAAATLNMQVIDLLYVNAEVPENTPETLAVLTVVPHPFDVDQLHQLLMPNNPVREENDGPGERYATLGVGDGESEYMLIELDFGRAYFNSSFWCLHLQEVMESGGSDPMTDQLHYYPEDREVAGLPRAEARKQAQDLIDALGIPVSADARILTVDEASYAHMLAELSVSDAQSHLPRRYLEPYDGAHDGYFMQFQLMVGDTPYLDQLGQLQIFVSRQGIEYLETGYVWDEAASGEPQTVLSAEAALKAAAPEMTTLVAENRAYVAGNYLGESEGFAPSTVERIRLGYIFNFKKKTMTPIWEYTFPRAMWTKTGTWQTRTFDNPAFIGLLQLNALTGEFIDSLQH